MFFFFYLCFFIIIYYFFPTTKAPFTQCFSDHHQLPTVASSAAFLQCHVVVWHVAAADGGLGLPSPFTLR